MLTLHAVLFPENLTKLPFPSANLNNIILVLSAKLQYSYYFVFASATPVVLPLLRFFRKSVIKKCT